MTAQAAGKPGATGPLQGLRVIELGSTVAGPFCARLMADFGADVIKVEQPEGDAVRSMGSSHAGSSLYGAFGAVMAVLERNRSGRGQVIDTALYEAAFSFMEPHVPAYQQSGLVAKRAGSHLPGNTPNALYATRDGRPVVITAASDPVFTRLVAAIGQPELARDPRFATGLARVENEAACDAAISAWTRTRTTEEVETVLHAAKVPATRIYTIADIFQDPHFRAREMLVGVADPQLGAVTLAGVVPKLSATPGAIWRAGPRLGEDTRAVLQSELGLSETEIHALEQNGTVRTDVPAPERTQP